MKVRDLIKKIEADGWSLVSIRGSHRQYEHHTKKGKVTVPGHLNDDVSPGLLNSIYRQARLEKWEDSK